MLTQEYLKSILNYNKDTGIFTWKIKKSSKLKIGSIAGKNNNGYIQIGINNKHYMAHRLAWLYVYGYMPNVIDHINGNRSDNKISNIRECTVSQNMHNKKMNKNNKSGVKGLNFKDGKWRTQIAINKKIKHIGYFEDFFEACCSIYSARNKLHGEFANHGNQ